jgi:hypothetical protein
MASPYVQASISPRDDRRRQEVRARGERVKPVSERVKPRAAAAGVSKGTPIQVDRVGAQVVVSMLRAGFGERHRSGRRGLTTRWREGDAITQCPKTDAKPRSAAAVPRIAKTAQK